MPYRKNNLTSILVTALWTNWAVAFGAIALTMVLPRLMPHFWLPLPVYLISYLVLVFMRKRVISGMMHYVAVLKASSLTLFWSATVMLAINLLHRNAVADEVFAWSSGNPEVPFITALVVFPVMCLMSLWVMFTGYGQTLAGDYRFREGGSGDTGVVSSLLTRANRYQVQLFCFIGAGISVIDWWYYYTYYINVNMNTPDVFFFNWLAVIFYLASLYFMWVRYSSLGYIIGPIVGANMNQGVLVRFLVLSGDRLLLTINQFDRWDTPVEAHIEPLKAHNEKDIRELYERLSGHENFEMKYLYESGATRMSNMQLHYAVFLPDDSSEEQPAKAQWFTLDQIDRMLRNAELSAEFTDELYRLFTITMAWKTYDRHGRRLYPIKNYRPTFRLRDMKNWTVDYDDPLWMAVARNNQDRPFFRTRRLWHKLTGLRMK